MLETLLEYDTARDMINSTSNDGVTPTLLALRSVNPICLKTLFNFGGELSLKSTDKNPLSELMQSNKGNTME